MEKLIMYSVPIQDVQTIFTDEKIYQESTEINLYKKLKAIWSKEVQFVHKM